MDPHQRQVIDAARRLAIRVEVLEDRWRMDAVRLSYRGRATVVIEGRIFTHLSTVADLIGANKEASKALMRELGLPVPESVTLDSGRLRATEITDFLREHPTAVAKPSSGTDGHGIAMHLTDAQQVIDHIQSLPEDIGRWLLEEQVAGQDLRLQFCGGELAAACIRQPCTLRGDGGRSIAALIDARNELIHRQNPDNHIEVDHQVRGRLEAMKLRLDSILARGQELVIKDVSNMAQGGHAIDVTDRVHPTYVDYLDRLAGELDLRVFSLDVMTTSPEADPAQFARVLEFNTRPAWLHHTFSEGRQHDIPGTILKDFFQIA